MVIKKFLRSEAIPERADAQFECVFVESATGQPQLNAAAVLTLVATLRDIATSTILNNRNAQNVKNLNGGVLATDGTFTLQLSADDNIVQTVGDPDTLEQHVLTLEGTFTRTGGGTGTFNDESWFYVRRLRDVP